ncbi:uncharacterized protein LOC121055033 [Oryza brachyantha]|uniref:uncharacterized protein LOC121055033 n=1 Tax=Oryza brachyantha TaxID=4533 RepID=UPI001ADC21FB|nr:uncharacterized protein LOC121055033 [Oryza brachyantha]
MVRTPSAVLLLLLLLATLLAASSVAASESEESVPAAVLTPVTDTPLGSSEGADGPVAAADTLDDDAVAPDVGSPVGAATMAGAKPELPNAPPGSIEGDDDAGASGSGGGGAAPAPPTMLAAAAAVVAAAVATAGVLTS